MRNAAEHFAGLKVAAEILKHYRETHKGPVLRKLYTLTKDFANLNLICNYKVSIIFNIFFMQHWGLHCQYSSKGILSLKKAKHSSLSLFFSVLSTHRCFCLLTPQFGNITTCPPSPTIQRTSNPEGIFRCHMGINLSGFKIRVAE